MFVSFCHACEKRENLWYLGNFLFLEGGTLGELWHLSNSHFNKNLKVCTHFVAIPLLFIGRTASFLPVSHCYFLVDWFNLHLPLLMRCITVDLISRCSWPQVIKPYLDFCGINCWESFGYKLQLGSDDVLDLFNCNILLWAEECTLLSAGECIFDWDCCIISF